VPAAIVERADTVQAMQRSVELTRHVRAPIVGLLLLLFGLGFAINWLCARGIPQPGLLLAISLLSTVLLGALVSTASAVTYHDLRELKDGIGSDALARVFD
jgi:hypothetical protein